MDGIFNQFISSWVLQQPFLNLFIQQLETCQDNKLVKGLISAYSIKEILNLSVSKTNSSVKPSISLVEFELGVKVNCIYRQKNFCMEILVPVMPDLNIDIIEIECSERTINLRNYLRFNSPQIVGREIISKTVRYFPINIENCKNSVCFLPFDEDKGKCDIAIKQDDVLSIYIECNICKNIGSDSSLIWLMLMLVVVISVIQSIIIKKHCLHNTPEISQEMFESLEYLQSNKTVQFEMHQLCTNENVCGTDDELLSTT